MKSGRNNPVFVIFFIALFSGALSVVNYFWIKNNLSHLPPPWDAAFYIYMALNDYDSLIHGGIVPFIQTFLHQAPNLAPLFPATAIPFFIFFGPGIQVAYLSNFFYLFILFLSAYFIADHLAGHRAGWLSVFIAATFPAIITFSRDFLFEFPLAALTALSYLFFLKSDSFRGRGNSILFGFFCGLSVLTKTMGFVFFVMPVLYAIYVFVKTTGTKMVKKNIAYSLLTALLVASIFYVPNFKDIFGYLFYYGVGEGSKNYNLGISGMLSLRYWTVYAEHIAGRGISLGYLLILASSILFYLFTGEKKLSKDYLLVWLWLICGYILLSLPKIRGGERFALPILLPIAIIISVHVMKLSLRPLKYILVTLVILIGIVNYAYQTMSEHCQYKQLHYKELPVLVPTYVTCNMQEELQIPPCKEWDLMPMLRYMDNSRNKESNTVDVLVAVDHHFLNSDNLFLYAKVNKLKGNLVSDFQFKNIARIPANAEAIKQLINQSQFIITKTGFQGPEYTNTNNYLVKDLFKYEKPLKGFDMSDGSRVYIYSGGLEKTY